MRKLRAAALIVLVLGAGAAYGVYRYLTSESFVAHVVQSKLASRYPQLRVSLRHARLDVSTGEITLNQFSLTPRRSDPQGALVALPEVRVRADREALRTGRIDARQIIVSQPRLRATRMPDGRWNVAELFPLPHFSETPPEIFIRDGTIQVEDKTNAAARPLILDAVNLRLTPEEGRRFHVSGTFGGSHLKQAYVDGYVDLDHEQWGLEGVIEKLAVGTGLLDVLPSPLAEHAERLRGITAPVELRYQLAGKGLDKPLRCKLEAVLESGRLEMPGLPLNLKTLTAGSLTYHEGRVTGVLRGRDGTFLDSRLPFGLYGVAASISIDGECLEGRLTGRNGVTEVQIDVSFEGGDFNRPVRVAAEVKRLPLDDRVYAALPADLQAVWDRYGPEGVVDVSFDITRAGETWQRRGVVTCRSGAFRFDEFPYRFSGVTGTVRDDGEVIVVDLVAQAGGRPVTIESRIEQRGSAAKTIVEVAGHQIPIDANFLEALPDPTRRVVRAMHPSGAFDVRARFSREGGPERSFDRTIALSLRNCSMRHDVLPYPLSEITGSITDRNGHWTFDLRGYNDTGSVVANGTLEPPERGGNFDLTLTGRGIAFEEELRRALQPDWAAVWDECDPEGTADFTARMGYRPGEPFRVTQVQIQLARASLRLKAFPYRWYNVQGSLVVQDREVEIRDLQAEHEQLRLRTNGRISRITGGDYFMRLEAMDAEQIQLDELLLDALPEGLANLSRDLEIQGPIDVRDAALELRWSGRRGEAARARWSVDLLLSDNSLKLGSRFEHVNGVVRVVGDYDGTTTRGRGAIEIASLSLLGLQLTRVTGPFQWQGNHVVFGADVWAPRPLRPAEAEKDHLYARLLGGVITADAVLRGTPATYRLIASLRGARLEQYAKQYMPDRQRLAGGLSGHIGLEGRRGAPDSLRGQGALRVEQGDLYELPLVWALLKIPSLKFPDTTAFTDAAASFKLGPEEASVSRIELRGDAVTLIGQGTASYNRRLHLTFYSMVGRDTFEIPFVTEIFRQASEQLLAIDVSGPFENPQARARPVPQVSATVLELLKMGRAR